MSYPFTLPSAKALRRLALMLLLSLALLSSPGESFAAGSICRGDPILYLSNGGKIQLFVAVNTDAASVTKVIYTVHIPAGVSVTKIVMDVPAISNLPGISTSKESVVWYADLTAKQYQATTQVLTVSPTTATATDTFTPSSTAASTSLSASGNTGANILISYTAP